MSDKRPLVLDDTGQLQRLQPGDQIKPEALPYDNSVDKTRRLVRLLVLYLYQKGFDDIPDELIDDVNHFE